MYDEQLLGVPVAVPSGGTTRWDFATYEVSLADLEALVSLRFDALHEPSISVRMDAPPWRVSDVREVDW